MTKTEFIPVEKIESAAYTIPTDQPESDGTLQWNATTLVVAKIHAGGKTGLGYTYSDATAADVIQRRFNELLRGNNCFTVTGCRESMMENVRNIGYPGLMATAISAVDTALWDLKARLLEVPLVTLMGQIHKGIPVYGSGGFTSYTIEDLQSQLKNWSDEGISMVKMKVGRNPAEDILRVRKAREAIGPKIHLMVDANGAFEAKQALQFARAFADYGVTWFEEPVSSDYLNGLRYIRDHSPAEIEIAAGEYGYTNFYFRRMLENNAVDVLQADATRCGGYTGFLKIATLAEAWGIPLSSHTAPALHLPVGCVVKNFRHSEYFHDHVRIESRFFEGFPKPLESIMYPDLSQPGNGLKIKEQDLQEYRI